MINFWMIWSAVAVTFSFGPVLLSVLLRQWRIGSVPTPIRAIAIRTEVQREEGSRFCGDQCNLREQFLNFSPLLNAETGTAAATERP